MALMYRRFSHVIRALNQSETGILSENAVAMLISDRVSVMFCLIHSL